MVQFEKKGPEWLEWHRGLCTDIFYTKERSVIINPPADQCYIKENAYQNTLAAAALSQETEDRVILMEPKRRMNQAIMNKLGISLFDVKDINDASGNNLFSMYTLPVNGKSVSEGEGSRKIAKWLGRFLKEENADVEIYSLKHEGLSEQQIKDKFSEEGYRRWKFSIFLVKSKKELHARSIQGTKYIIQIDRGLSVFGRDGKTFQTLISIYENKGMPRIALSESKLKQIV